MPRPEPDDKTRQLHRRPEVEKLVVHYAACRSAIASAEIPARHREQRGQYRHGNQAPRSPANEHQRRRNHVEKHLDANGPSARHDTVDRRRNPRMNEDEVEDDIGEIVLHLYVAMHKAKRVIDGRVTDDRKVLKRRDPRTTPHIEIAQDLTRTA